MAEEQTQLPRLPAVSWDERSQSFSKSRKRALNTPQSQPSSGINSSDPAVFSSDDDPGLDNYVNGRRKRRYFGSWYDTRPVASNLGNEPKPLSQTKPPGKRNLTRQYDSGVFLGSDGTEEGFEDGHTIVLPTQWKLPKLGKHPAPRVDPIEQAVRDKIRAALDSGEETIDLWHIGLRQISDHTIDLLSQAASVPVVTKGVAFEQKEPELKLYVANNFLSKVPAPLFDITNLTILSLRGNQLTELPSGIGKLHNLTELNVSQNQLRFLPAEIADLMAKHRKLKSLIMNPNPFLEPEGDPWTDASLSLGHGIDNHLILPNTEGLYGKFAQHLMSNHLFSSPLQVKDSNGRVVSAFRITSEHHHPVAILSREQIKEQQTFLKKQSHRVPTLLELAARKCHTSSYLDEMARVMPPELSHLRKLLEQASAQKETGGYSCSKCHRTIIVPTLEWIEWRTTTHIDHARDATLGGSDSVSAFQFRGLSRDLVTPFLYRACSWACGPDDGPGTGRNLLLNVEETLSSNKA